jgi:hypothetical protein
MDLLRVEAAMLRALAPDLVLREGMRVVASVAERAGQKGIIVLAGTPLAALLPDDVKAGDVLRLIVTEASGDRIVLRIADAQAAPQTPPTVVDVPLPEGMSARIAVAEREGGGARDRREAEQPQVRLTYTSARLGAIDLHLTLAGDELVRVNVRARAGAPFDLAERNAPALQQAIAAATGRPAQVVVSPRHDPLNVYG